MSIESTKCIRNNALNAVTLHYGDKLKRAINIVDKHSQKRELSKPDVKENKSIANNMTAAIESRFNNLGPSMPPWETPNTSIIGLDVQITLDVETSVKPIKVIADANTEAPNS